MFRHNSAPRQPEPQPENFETEMSRLQGLASEFFALAQSHNGLRTKSGKNLLFGNNMAVMEERLSPTTGTSTAIFKDGEKGIWYIATSGYKPREHEGPGNTIRVTDYFPLAIDEPGVTEMEKCAADSSGNLQVLELMALKDTGPTSQLLVQNLASDLTRVLDEIKISSVAAA